MFHMRQIILLVPMLVLMLASSAWAQTPEGARADNAWLTPAAAILLACFVVAVSIKKSKREHRD